ncbi:ABC transporter ATP-binding protein [Epibacterium sp. Ofav1-8]|uniref:ABC transporter ATP-binding protein n=1 Tax=Epibacterium sp. Ofav1-8 TaxID=2917735 RepID=UPI001EF4B6FA|nr:ABC transporter ATP-binding protein [Epibacterium sp. Ofav1-8]MCG7625085.1 ABC transporter ATP-binding protein [Epibacterium sp. Ofav1-8]
MTDQEASHLEFRDISKSFGPVVANNSVSFKVERGTVHGLIGENGAGKTTLMSMLFGLYDPDGGEVLINGARADIKTPSDAIRLGIGMVHQHFMLVERQTALQNLMLGSEGGFWLGRRNGQARREIEAIQQRYGLEFPLDVPVGQLAVGIQQRIEIVKALYRGAELLILDEPTSVLTPPEVELLFHVMRDLVADGKTVVLITHKLQEVMEATRNVTILRHGEVVDTLRTAETSREALAEGMVGRALRARPVERKPCGEAVKVSVENLTVCDSRDIRLVRDVSFEIREGEILGVAGVSGNGQSEILRAMAGLMPVTSGRIRMRDIEIGAGDSIGLAELRQRGVGLVPEDRLGEALVGAWPASENAVLGLTRTPFYDTLTARYPGAEMHSEWCGDLMRDHDVRPADPARRMSFFSGGNQQKLVIGRELSFDPDVLLIGQPTRGVDIGAIEFIHDHLRQERDKGKALMVVSVELEELIALSDRVLVMFEGRSMGVLDKSEFSERRIGMMMAGYSKEATAEMSQEVAE